MQHHSDPPEPFPHNEDAQLRKLGLSTTLQKGVPTLSVPHVLCKKGKPLKSEQAQLLKLIGERMVEFRVQLKARWNADTGQVFQTESEPLEETTTAAGGEDADDGHDSDAMSD